MGSGIVHPDVAGHNKNRVRTGGELADPFFTTVYVDDYLLITVQHSDHGTTSVIASSSLASDHVRLFWTGEGKP